jgi:hypothetical protein
VGCQACLFTTAEQVLGHTLIDGLAGTVDCLRDLYTTLGLRSYQVQLVWTRWSSGERGIGQEFVVAVEPLLPTPKLNGLGGVARELRELGTNEQGSITVSEIALRYGEDLLLGRGGPLPLGEAIPADVSFFWEIYLPTGNGEGIRRRFTPNGAPERQPGKFQWSVRLVESEGARLRDGRLE